MISLDLPNTKRSKASCAGDPVGSEHRQFKRSEILSPRVQALRAGACMLIAKSINDSSSKSTMLLPSTSSEGGYHGSTSPGRDGNSVECR
jgi:hypothetical protein